MDFLKTKGYITSTFTMGNLCTLLEFIRIGKCCTLAIFKDTPYLLYGKQFFRIHGGLFYLAGQTI